MSYRELMLNSESFVEYALEEGDDHEKAITERLTEEYRRYRDWELRHSRLMWKVARSNGTQQEIYRLRETAASQLQISAIWRYIKARGIKGEELEILMKGFHPCRDYADAIVYEHANYIRAETSCMCSIYLTAILGDLGLDDWFENYRKGFDGYFGMFCDGTIAEAKGEEYLMKPLILQVKADAVGQKVKLLNSASRLHQDNSLNPIMRELVSREDRSLSGSPLRRCW